MSFHPFINDDGTIINVILLLVALTVLLIISVAILSTINLCCKALSCCNKIIIVPGVKGYKTISRVYKQVIPTQDVCLV
ncbi:envelope protein [Shrew coronavirus]|uniref:Envelope protein n=1 Tax=Common shrew coronavirus Tibet-2014 TaxID=2849711 RepID=A0A2H4N023_9ALPC|nr:envelope protein [Shrew coronavirus]ATP66785.1 envelope protein [Common shrew coronavirus Tibet-2014]